MSNTVQRKIAAYLSPSGISRPAEEILAVITEFVDRITNIIQGQMGAFLAITTVHRGKPAARQLFDGADIQIAVMEIAFQVRHTAGEKAAVLANAVTAHRRSAGRHVLCEKFQG